jgi:hypothetical protein
MAMFERIEGDLIGLGQRPISKQSWLPKLERTMLEHWESGRNISIRDAVCQTQGLKMATPCGGARVANGNQEHGDHWDAPDGVQHSDGSLVIHGDQGSTIMHADSNKEPNA